jgi:hypothetical protein
MIIGTIDLLRGGGAFPGLGRDFTQLEWGCWGNTFLDHPNPVERILPLHFLFFHPRGDFHSKTPMISTISLISTRPFPLPKWKVGIKLRFCHFCFDLKP